MEITIKILDGTATTQVHGLASSAAGVDQALMRASGERGVIPEAVVMSDAINAGPAPAGLSAQPSGRQSSGAPEPFVASTQEQPTQISASGSGHARDESAGPAAVAH